MTKLRGLMLGMGSALALVSLADLPATAQSSMSNGSMMNHRSMSNGSMMNHRSMSNGSMMNHRSMSNGSMMNHRSMSNGSTTMLMMGSTGSAVRRVQNTLKTQGFFKGRINGVYDSSTESAVMRFQRANGLVSDGIVGPNTRAALY